MVTKNSSKKHVVSRLPGLSDGRPISSFPMFSFRCDLMETEYNALTLELEHIRALAGMGLPDEYGPPHTALLLIQERAGNIATILNVAQDRSTVGRGRGVSNG